VAIIGNLYENVNVCECECDEHDCGHENERRSIGVKEGHSKGAFFIDINSKLLLTFAIRGGA
jgi:hypothetical protein